MNWEQKTEMIKLGNKAVDKQSRDEFQQCVLKYIDTFDHQAYNMFLECIALLPDEFKEDREFYEKIYPIVKKYFEGGSAELGLRSGMRMAMLLTICEEELKITN